MAVWIALWTHLYRRSHLVRGSLPVPWQSPAWTDCWEGLSQCMVLAPSLEAVQPELLSRKT